MKWFRRGEQNSEPGETISVFPLADHGLLFRFGDQIDRELSGRIVALANDLFAQVLPGVIDVIPSYTTLVLILEPGVADVTELADTVSEMWKAGLHHAVGEHDRPEMVIPVAYGGDGGPDLLDVARSTGLTADEVIARHQGASYQVGAIGFAPGFAFLIGLPSELTTPRRTTPRTSVPAGSVGIGGAQTGIYSLETPGGWSLIGRTTTRMFDPERNPPSLLQAGDHVRFLSVPVLPSVVVTRPVINKVQPSFHDGLEVLAAGMQTTIQDLGRPRYGQSGVAPGGAADKTALIAGNRLVGNPDGAAGLEMTLIGPRLRMLKPGRLVLTGADFGATLNGYRLPVGAVRVVGPGDELWFAPGQPRRGARAYLCVTGGIDVAEQLGSRSTDLNGGFGGLEGRALKAGDRLRIGKLQEMTSQPAGPLASIRTEIGVLSGPQRDRFSDETWMRFLDSEFTISPLSNRMGVRLDGSRLIPEGGADIISEGMVTGAIQVTGEGQPIVMLPARATIGGYPKIAVVVAADLDALGQLKPGDTVRFRNGAG